MPKKLIVSSDDADVLKDAKFLGISTLDELEDMRSIEVTSKMDELDILETELGENTIVRFTDDEIIPLENLIANLHGKTNIIVAVDSIEKAKTALETLELGADGVVLETDDPSLLPELAKIGEGTGNVKLEAAMVTDIRVLGLGSRVCIDTCSLIPKGSGMLVGSSSQGMILVQSEVEENEFVSPRPFRVNAGALALYTSMPEGKTKYLEEISAGDEVMIVSSKGATSAAYVARSKIESRPLILVEVQKDGKIAKAILQNAETVKLVSPSGSIAVTELELGDEVMARFEEGGRHFGVLVKKEEVIEK